MESWYQKPALSVTLAATRHSSLSNGRSALQQEVKSLRLKVRNPAEKIINIYPQPRHAWRCSDNPGLKDWPVIPDNALIEQFRTPLGCVVGYSDK